MAKLQIDYKNEPQTVMINAHYITLASKIELRWYQYLKILERAGELTDIQHEPGAEDETGQPTFRFKGYISGAVQYTPDFRATLFPLKENAGPRYLYYECKGIISSDLLTKCQRLAKHYPDVRLWLVIMQLPNKKTIQYRRLQKINNLIERVVVARPIFRQCGIK